MPIMQIHGWGKYPIVDSQVVVPRANSAVKETLRNGFAGIARGLGRSYGDSSLAPTVLSTLSLDHYIEFDATTGRLRAGAGVSLDDVLATMVPRGWFLPVTPGTKFVTLGGAVAADVHGKNHHVDGTFCDHVTRLTLATSRDETIACSPQDHPELFRATCGGMGLTGVILDVELSLKPIASAMIDEKIFKTANLEETCALLHEHASATYSVAWIDCLARGDKLGRSLLMLGEHSAEGELRPGRDGRLAVPFELPSFTLNSYSVRTFNWLYYHRVLRQSVQHRVHYDKFFYPLDGVRQWNRIYGRRGFTQYQFVLPKETGAAGMRQIIERIASSQRGSFLAVLKAFGKENENYLSFPREGLTLALDFKIDDALFMLLEELDQIVLDLGGRIYLAKDVRMSPLALRRGYPRLEQFLEVCRRYGADKQFRSQQSQRLGIN